MRSTTEIARLETQKGAEQATEILRANGIECSVEDNSVTPLVAGAVPLGPGQGGYRVFVAREDQVQAREALQGAFVSEWFLCLSDGRRFHSFEAATVDVLRHYVVSHADADDFALREISYLADLMERQRWQTVFAAFHEGHYRQHPRPVEGRSLDEWAQSCGCFHQQIPLGA